MEFEFVGNWDAEFNKNWGNGGKMANYSLDERIHNAIQFSLFAFDTPERRERIIQDVRKAIGDTKFEKTIVTSINDEPLVEARWEGDELIVTIVKPEPVEAEQSAVE